MTNQLPESIEELLSSTPRFTPTAEQSAILEAALSCETSIMLESMAGCTKTSTIEILIRAQKRRPSVYLVFNKRNKIEAEKAFADPDSKWAHLGDASHADVKTMNGFGHGAWSRAIGRRLTLKEDKLLSLLREITKTIPRDELSREDFTNILALARRARIAGLVPSKFNRKGLIDDTLENWQKLASDLWLDDVSEEHFVLACRLLTDSVKQGQQGIIDFDDQIYLPTLFGGVFPRYEYLYGDEVQDYSPLNKRQILLANAARLFLVGDARQAIYAFRGADHSSMESLRTLRKEWINLPLSTTFRCPKAVVARQQSHAPGYRAADSNADGRVDDWRIIRKPEPKPDDRPEWSITEIPATEEVAILCRNNAPLLACALRCLKAGRGASILGSEIGRGLATLARKISGGAEGEGESSRDFAVKLKDWYETEHSKALANDQEEKANLIQDKYECLIALAEGLPDTAAILAYLARIFEPSNVKITLSTGHKAKGLEWDTVIHLDPWRIPSKFAQRDPAQLRQEMNLKYVIETRAKARLILANMEHMI